MKQRSSSRCCAVWGFARSFAGRSSAVLPFAETSVACRSSKASIVVFVEGPREIGTDTLMEENCGWVKTNISTKRCGCDRGRFLPDFCRGYEESVLVIFHPYRRPGQGGAVLCGRPG